mgnify:CR=1 FL=1
MEVEEDTGIIARIVMNMSLFHLDATQDYALAAARDTQTNGHQCFLKDLRKTYSIDILSLEFQICSGNIFRMIELFTKF